MNYCEKIHYTILNTEPAEFAVMVDDLLSQLPQNEVIGRKSVGIMGIANRL